MKINTANIKTNQMTSGVIETIKRVYSLTDHGTPVGLDRIVRNTAGTKWYKIVPENDLADRVYVRYDGDVKLVDTRYAVFCKTGTGPWQQCSKWYCYYKICQRRMYELADVKYDESADGRLYPI